MTVLVIGGSGGIGQAVVRKAAGAGSKVVFTYLRAADTAGALVDELTAADADVTARGLDIRDLDALQATIDDAAADGLDTVALAAGSGVPRATMTDFRRKHWDWAFDTHARAFAETFRLSVGHLSRTAGSLVTISSVGSRLALPDYSMVGPAKAAVESSVRYAAAEGGPLGVRVNAISAGAVETKALTAYPEYQRRIAKTAEGTPLGRLVTGDDVAEVLWWLASPGASMITGQVIVVDGGWELRGGVS